MREPPERRDGLDLVVAQTLLVAAAALITAPALVIAVPLALAIDRRGWRRWPALVLGSGLTAGAVAAGALDAYLATLHQGWLTVRHGSTFPWTQTLGLVPLALTAGIALGPVLQAATHHCTSTRRPGTSGR